ncbi:MAG: PQQ-binding-like beta-propeller repeat protein, partial [Phycisphaeraceae bacterium]|nr:PQQ-binding-like beta-propeller repeat protein [Phycisphaeraceae bacterium]
MIFACGPVEAEQPVPETAAAKAEKKIIIPPGRGESFEALKYFAAPKPLAEGAVTEDWPSFLGASHIGISREKPLLKKWPDTGPAKVWQMTTGSGYAAPCVVGNRLVYFHRLDDEQVVECLRADNGRRLWRFAYPSDYRDRFGYNNGPRASPVHAEGRVFTLGVQGKLHALSLADGRVLWKRDLGADHKLRQNFFGFGTTPLIDSGRLIVNVGAVGGPTVVGFDPATGRVLWSSGKRWGSSYATPVPATVHGQKRVMVFAGGESRPPHGGLICLNPVDGQIDFEVAWRSRSYESVNAANPVVVGGDRVFVTATYDTGGLMVRIKPDFTQETAWEAEGFGSHFGTPILHEGHLYGFDGRNPPLIDLVCYEAKTGREVWRKKLTWEDRLNGRAAEMSPYRAALIRADGAFLCLGEYGHLLWLDLSPEGPKILARHWLFTAMETWTPPVISRGLLYVTQNSRDQVTGARPRLICYDLRA